MNLRDFLKQQKEETEQRETQMREALRRVGEDMEASRALRNTVLFTVISPLIDSVLATLESAGIAILGFETNSLLPYFGFIYNSTEYHVIFDLANNRQYQFVRIRLKDEQGFLTEVGERAFLLDNITVEFIENFILEKIQTLPGYKD